MQVVYALRFQGTSTPGTDKKFKGSTEARGLDVSSVVEAHGVAGTLHEVTGGHTARLHSDITQTGATSFTEAGTITFGEGGDVLRFSTVGEGYIDGDPTGTMRGAVIWRVDGGTGVFAGATGLITSNFAITDDRVTDHHWGVITLA